MEMFYNLKLICICVLIIGIIDIRLDYFTAFPFINTSGFPFKSNFSKLLSLSVKYEYFNELIMCSKVEFSYEAEDMI
jgi:hypothetical protein